MAEGGDIEKKVDLIVEIFTEGLKDLEDVDERFQNLADSIEESTDRVTGQTDAMSESLEANQQAAEETEQSFMELTGQGLALLFAGRFLSQTFGSLSSKMLDVFGVSDAMGATMISVLAPAFEQITPLLMKFSEFMMGLSDNVKMVIGGFVIVATVLAPIISLFGQMMALAASFGTTVPALFSKFAAAAGPVLAVVGALAAGFMVGVEIVKRFGKVVASIVLVIAAVVAAIASAPVVIAAAIGVILGIIWGMRDDIASALGDVKDFILKIPDHFKNAASSVKSGISSIIDKIAGFADEVSSTAKELGNDFVDALVKAIKSGGGRIKDAVTQPIDNAWEGVSNVGSGIQSRAGGAIQSVRGNDFVMSDGKMVRTHPNDMLFATKDPDSLGDGGGGGDVTINVDRPQLNKDMDVDKMLERIKRDLDRETRGRSGGLGR